MCFSFWQFGMFHEVARFQDGVWRCGLFKLEFEFEFEDVVCLRFEFEK